MSVRPELLKSSEGELVCISIAVESTALESLLESLAGVEFPINPQIYHDAALISRYPDGSEDSIVTTLVEFPAYAGRVGEVRSALSAFGFDPESIRVTGMLEEIQSATSPKRRVTVAGREFHRA